MVIQMWNLFSLVYQSKGWKKNSFLALFLLQNYVLCMYQRLGHLLLYYPGYFLIPVRILSYIYLLFFFSMKRIVV